MATDYRLLTIYYVLLTVYHLLLTVYCLILTTYYFYLLRTAFYLPVSTYYLRSTTCCVLVNFLAFQAWELLMRVPTYAQRLSALSRPDVLSWTSEFSLREAGVLQWLHTHQLESPETCPTSASQVITAMADWDCLWLAGVSR